MLLLAISRFPKTSKSKKEETNKAKKIKKGDGVGTKGSSGKPRDGTWLLSFWGRGGEGKSARGNPQGRTWWRRCACQNCSVTPHTHEDLQPSLPNYGQRKKPTARRTCSARILPSRAPPPQPWGPRARTWRVWRSLRVQAPGLGASVVRAESGCTQDGARETRSHPGASYLLVSLSRRSSEGQSPKASPAGGSRGFRSTEL